ncbi:MAG TPA: SPFH domain-containing protein [Thermoflexales bacterium]|nr:SPFH domain-containing protein [Thermoflexales bacterium]HQW36920.1 SPFH domain-containing protein [Thermoflexales bacterium]HQZ23316.1 SPFH domain-containing protein [Thermoflexales bacterium]HRA00726.1 SPFH domain-containing protein [Thermoflexales bacterium]
MTAGVILLGMVLGFLLWLIRTILPSLYTVNQNERAVKTSFGKAVRMGKGSTLDHPISQALRPEERERYEYPLVQVIQPGGPYIKWPWEKVYKVSVAIQTVSLAYDAENPTVNQNGTILEAVTKDQLNTELKGQIRFKVSEDNLYAYLFAIKNPLVHIMGYFHSILRERIANFEAPVREGVDAALPTDATTTAGISINDLRKNLRDINEHMDVECAGSSARYGVALDASLITAIDPPAEVENALAAINTAYNQVSSDISVAQASADQKIVQSKRAVEIETLKAQAETEPLLALAQQLTTLRNSGPDALETYLRYVRLGLYANAKQAITEVK